MKSVKRHISFEVEFGLYCEILIQTGYVARWDVYHNVRNPVTVQTEVRVLGLILDELHEIR